MVLELKSECCTNFSSYSFTYVRWSLSLTLYRVLHRLLFLFFHLCEMIRMLNSLVLHLLPLLFLYESEMILMLNCWVLHLLLLLFVHVLGFNCTLCACFTSDNGPKVASDLLSCMRWSLGFPLSDTPASLPVGCTDFIVLLTLDDRPWDKNYTEPESEQFRILDKEVTDYVSIFASTRSPSNSRWHYLDLVACLHLLELKFDHEFFDFMSCISRKVTQRPQRKR